MNKESEHNTYQPNTQSTNVKRILLIACVALCALMAMQYNAMAQFETGKLYVGPHIGLGSVGGAISFGGDAEYGVTKPGEVGPGRIGVGMTVDYWKWSSDSYLGSYWSHSYIPIGFFGAYHFDLADRKLDPYVGLGLGYYIVNSSWEGADGTEHTSSSYSSTTYWNVVAGLRYFISPGFAVQGRLGLGASWLSAGVNFAL